MTFCLLLLPLSAFAQQQAPEVPQITFEQQVDIVVTAKKNPSIYDLRFKQDNDLILLDATVDRNVAVEQAKAIAQALIILTKTHSIDDKPKEKNVPGKGLFNYRVTVTRPDGVVLITALKPIQAEKVDYENAFEAEPLTRADANAR